MKAKLRSTGTKLYARLRSMLNQAGEAHYQRIKLAYQLLRDKGWVKSLEGGGGDEDIAIDRLEQDCFGDLCGLVSLSHLLEIYRTFPRISVWAANKFNFRKMIAELRQKETGKPATKTTKPTRRVHAEVQSFRAPRVNYKPQVSPKGNITSAYDQLLTAYNDLKTERDELYRENQQLRRQLNRQQRVTA